MKKVILFICFILFTSEVLSGGHIIQKYGYLPPVKFSDLHKAQCSKKGICEFTYKDEEIRRRAIELGFSSRSLRVRMLDFEPHSLMRFSNKCYRQEDWINRMWTVTAEEIEKAKHITVVGRKHKTGMIGTVYFDRRNSAHTVMKKFRRSNNYCTS